MLKVKFGMKRLSILGMLLTALEQIVQEEVSVLPHGYISSRIAARTRYFAAGDSFRSATPKRLWLEPCWYTVDGQEPISLLGV